MKKNSVKISDNEFRTMFLADPQRFRRLVLTEPYVLSIRCIETIEPCTASTLANFQGITIQAASAKLKHLTNLGYLKREQKVDTRTGGIYYEYESFRF